MCAFQVATMIPATTHAMTNNNKSRSIPIEIDEKQLREEHERYEGAVVADIKDYMFCSRLVDGMRKQQEYRQDIGLKYQNQALIDHIINTRRSDTTTTTTTDEHQQHPTLMMPHPSQLRSSNNSSYSYLPNDTLLSSTVQDVLGMMEDDEELIFDMEL